MNTDIMTIREVAEYLKLTEKTTYRLAAEDKIIQTSSRFARIGTWDPSANGGRLLGGAFGSALIRKGSACVASTSTPSRSSQRRALSEQIEPISKSGKSVISSRKLVPFSERGGAVLFEDVSTV